MTSRRAAVNFVLITALLDIVAIGLVVPVQPKLVEMFMGGDTARGAIVFGLMSTLWALMQFLFQSVLGALSDRYGRRPVLLFSNLGLGLDYILMALAPDLAWLFVGRVLSGIAAATFSTATAYIADVTPPDQRATEFSKIGIAFGVGFMIGPAIGGFLGATDPRLPFWTAAALSLTNALYGYFILPESLSPENRKPFHLRTSNPISALRILARDRIMVSISVGLFLYALAHTALPTLFVFYVSHRYHWTPKEIGYALAFAAFATAIVQGGLIRVAIMRFGDRLTMLLGFLSGALGFIVQGVAATPAIFFLGYAVFSIWGFIGPAAQQILTARVPANEQGLLQGANGSVTAIANLTGPLFFTGLFAWSIGPAQPDFMAGAAYAVAGLLLLFGMVLTYLGTRDVATVRETP